MASEHEHQWEMRLTSLKCGICDASIRYEQLDDLLKAEQQLAQARADVERLQARDAEWTESQAHAVTRYAQARALLERVRNVQIGSLSPTLADDVRAFLAAHPAT